MGWLARALGFGKTYEELTPIEREWVDNCGYHLYSPGGTVYYDEATLAKCKADAEVDAMAIQAFKENLGLPPINASPEEMRLWMQERRRAKEMENMQRRLDKYENQRRSSLRNSRHRPKKSRMVRGKSKLRHRNNSKVSYS